MSVLVTDAEQKSALSVVQSLGKRGLAVACMSSNHLAPSFYSKYCSQRIYFRETSDESKYVDFLENLVKKKKYELFMPCTDYSTKVISRNRNRFLPHSKIFLPSDGLIKMATSKARLMKSAKEHNIPVPKTFFPEDLEDAKRISDHVRYPAVVKGDVTSSAQKVRFARTKEELINKYSEIRQLDLTPIIQEFIEGTDKFFYGLCDKGEIIAHFMLEVVRSHPPSGGTPAKAFSIYDERLKYLSFQFLKSLSWTGILGLDFKQDSRNGEYYLLDFNPRFGATIALAIKSGVDFPYLLYKLAVEGKIDRIHEYSKNTYTSLFREEILYGLQRPLTVPKLIMALLEPGVDYGFDRNDLQAYFYLLKHTKQEIKKAMMKRMKFMMMKQ